jgi:hypothetical protein
MNQVLVPTDGSYCSWGYPCVYQYYSYWALASLVVVAATQFLIMKVCRITSFLVAPRQSVVSLCVLFIVIIQWRYLIAASQYVPKSVFASDILHSLDCDNSTKGGKGLLSTRDCTHGQLFNCSKQVPCTACNPSPAMDEKAVWNWWVNNDNPCQACNTSTTECDRFELGGAYCSTTFDGPLFDGNIRSSTLAQNANPLEFWRTKVVSVSSICCCVLSVWLTILLTTFLASILFIFSPSFFLSLSLSIFFHTSQLHQYIISTALFNVLLYKSNTCFCSPRHEYHYKQF